MIGRVVVSIRVELIKSIMLRTVMQNVKPSRVMESIGESVELWKVLGHRVSSKISA